MRQIFSSQRVETVEGVAELLRENGIEVHISNGRSYHGKRRGQFSYMEQEAGKSLPTAWIVHSKDQLKARDLLRAIGLLDSTRYETSMAQLENALENETAKKPTGQKLAWKIRIALLIGIVCILAFTFIRYRSHSNVASSPAVQTAPETENDAQLEEFRVPYNVIANPANN